MRLSFNKMSFATQFIISDVYPNVWKSFRFKVSPTCIPYICAEGFITDTRKSVHLTGNTFTKKQFLFAFTNEVNIMHLSLETPNPQPGKTWGMGGALWGLWLSAPLKGVGDNAFFFPLHSQGGGELVHFGLCFAWWGWGLEYFSLLPCPSWEE